MRISVCALGVCLVFGAAGATVPAAAVNSPSVPRQLNDRLLTQWSPQTLLEFQTENYAIRVYQQQGALYLNVYNKETGFTDLHGVSAYIAEPRSRDDRWLTYVNVGGEGDLEYRARVHPSGKTELEIRVAGGTPARPEVGYDATYNFPYSYLGQDIDATLSELEGAGWVIDGTRRNQIALTREQLALDLQYDPGTRLVTNTFLKDLT